MKDYKAEQSNKKYVKHDDLSEKSRNNNLYLLMFVVLVLIIISIFLLFQDKNKVSLKEPVYNPSIEENFNNNDINNENKTSSNEQTDVDFAPYMKNLEKKIKYNWHPPKGNESKRVVVLFKVDKGGRLLNLKIYESSGVQEVDDAAYDAIINSSPFESLPVEYRGNDVDIQFTFDYNVFRI